MPKKDPKETILSHFSTQNRPQKSGFPPKNRLTKSRFSITNRLKTWFSAKFAPPPIQPTEEPMGQPAGGRWWPGAQFCFSRVPKNVQKVLLLCLKVFWSTFGRLKRSCGYIPGGFGCWMRGMASAPEPQAGTVWTLASENPHPFISRKLKLGKKKSCHFF